MPPRHTLHRFPREPGRQPFQNTSLYTNNTRKRCTRVRLFPHRGRWNKILGSEAKLRAVESGCYLGWGHTASCCFAPCLTCARKAATTPPGCTCSCGRSGGCAGCAGCFCWRSSPRRRRPLTGTLRTEAVLLRPHRKPTPPSIAAGSHHRPPLEMILQPAHSSSL